MAINASPLRITHRWTATFSQIPHGYMAIRVSRLHLASMVRPSPTSQSTAVTVSERLDRSRSGNEQASRAPLLLGVARMENERQTMETLWQDMRFGLRMLGKGPSFYRNRGAVTGA